MTLSLAFSKSSIVTNRRPISGRHQGRLVHKVRQISTREARRAARDDAQVDIRAKGYFAGMHAKDFLAAFDVRVWHLHLTVKTTGTQKGRVQNVGTVGCGHDDDAFVGFKTVHLNQKLVQRLLAFVVTAAIADATRPANRVDLVDEDDARRVLFGLFEHVADTACTDTNEHFNEIRAGNREERHACFARNRTCQKRLTGTRRTHQQSAPLGILPPRRENFCGVAQEFDDLFKFFLGFVDAGNIIKRHAAMLFGQKLGARFAKAHRAASATALHPVHEVNPDTDQQKERQERHQDRHEPRLFLRLWPECDLVVDQQISCVCAFWLDRHIVTAIRAAEYDPFAVDGRI